MAEKIYIGIDNERIEATGELLESLLKAREDAQKQKEREEAETSIKAEARAALLERLGLTEEEAKLLLS